MRYFPSFLLSFAAATACALSPAVAAAQDYPDRPVRLVVPWSAGGATDQIARLLSQPLSDALGTSIVIENKGGAGGNIGTAAVAREKPDGYTLLLATSSTNAAGPHLYARQGFDPIKDFDAVVLLVSIPNVLVVPARSPWTSLQAVIQAANDAPGKFTYGSGGIGSSQHLAASQLRTATGIDLRHIPYKGSGPAAQDLIAGHLDLMIDTGSLGSIRGGLLRPLAVASAKRIAALPDVPTFAEAGTPMLASAWYGVMVPAGTPASIVNRLNAAFNKVLRNPDVRARLQQIGADVHGGSAHAFGEFARAEIDRYEVLVRNSGAPKE